MRFMAVKHPDMSTADLGRVLWNSIKNLRQDKGLQLAAALSYYAALSLAPLLLVLLAVVGMIFGREAVAGELVNQMRQLVGTTGADIALTVIHKTQESPQGPMAGIVGLNVLGLGAMLFVRRSLVHHAQLARLGTEFGEVGVQAGDQFRRFGQ